MTSQENTEPFQFHLGSVFLITSAIAVAFGLLHWFGPDAFSLQVMMAVQFVAISAILVTSKGTAWPSVATCGLIAAAIVQVSTGFEFQHLPHIFYWASFAAWLGGGLAADAESKRRSRFLRWAWLLALPLKLAQVAIELAARDGATGCGAAEDAHGNPGTLPAEIEEEGTSQSRLASLSLTKCGPKGVARTIWRQDPEFQTLEDYKRASAALNTRVITVRGADDPLYEQ